MDGMFHRVCVFRNGNRGESPQEQAGGVRERPREARVRCETHKFYSRRGRERNESICYFIIRVLNIDRRRSPQLLFLSFCLLSIFPEFATNLIPAPTKNIGYYSTERALNSTKSRDSLQIYVTLPGTRACALRRIEERERRRSGEDI